MVKPQKSITVASGVVGIEDLTAEAVVVVPVSLHMRPPLALVPDGDGVCLASLGAVPGKSPGLRRANATCAARSMLASVFPPPAGHPPVTQCHMVGAACVGGGPSVYVVAAPLSRLSHHERIETGTGLGGD